MCLATGLTCNPSNGAVHAGAHEARYVCPQTDPDHVDGARRDPVFLRRRRRRRRSLATRHTAPSNAWRQGDAARDAHLDHLNKSREVVGRLVRVLHRFEVIDVGSSVVPVHDDQIHVLASQQLLDDVLQPGRWRPGGPVPVDEEGGGPGGVEVGLGRQVGVGHEVAAGGIFPGVEQQPHVHVGSDDCVAQVQVSEVIAVLSWRRREFEAGRRWNGAGFTTAVAKV